MITGWTPANYIVCGVLLAANVWVFWAIVATARVIIKDWLRDRKERQG